MPRNMTGNETDASKNKDGHMTLHYPMLARNNYTAWAIKMKVFMQAQGVWDAVESKNPREVVDVRKDKMALAAIYQGLPEELLLSLAEKETAKEAWETLKVMYMGAERVKTAKVQTLKAEFEALKMNETDSVDDFSMKLNNLVNNIRALGDKIDEAYVVKKLLRAVPTKFLQIASTIEQFGDLDTMSVEEVVGRLKTHEERIRGPGESDEKKLLLTQEEWKARFKKTGTGESSSNQKHQSFDAGHGRGRGRGRGRSNRGGRGGRHGGGSKPRTAGGPWLQRKSGQKHSEVLQL